MVLKFKWSTHRKNNTSAFRSKGEKRENLRALTESKLFCNSDVISIQEDIFQTVLTLTISCSNCVGVRVCSRTVKDNEGELTSKRILRIANLLFALLSRKDNVPLGFVHIKRSECITTIKQTPFQININFVKTKSTSKDNVSGEFKNPLTLRQARIAP